MNALEAARRETARGHRVLPVPFRQKKCVLDGWPSLRLELRDLDKYFNGQPSNIGVLLGSPSGNLVDVDLDAPEARALADLFLPPTWSVFGRASKPRSHREYICAVGTQKFADVGRRDDDD